MPNCQKKHTTHKLKKVPLVSESVAVEVDSASFTWSDPAAPTLSQVRTRLFYDVGGKQETVRLIYQKIYLLTQHDR